MLPLLGCIFSCILLLRVTAGGPFIPTSYDYDAPIDEYGKLVIHQTLDQIQVCLAWFWYLWHLCSSFAVICCNYAYIRRFLWIFYQANHYVKHVSSEFLFYLFINLQSLTLDYSY